MLLFINLSAPSHFLVFFFFNDTATTEIYTLSLHDALPIWDQTEREARAFIEAVPNGTYEAESFLDNDGRSLDTPLRIKVKVVIAGGRMIVDFSEMNEQVPGPTNSGYSGGLAAARIAYKCLTQPR